MKRAELLWRFSPYPHDTTFFEFLRKTAQVILDLSRVSNKLHLSAPVIQKLNDTFLNFKIGLNF